jgi:hypothetical protein
MIEQRPEWDSILGKPDLVKTADLPSALASYATTAYVVAGFAPLAHTHAIADVSGLQTALNAKIGGSLGSTDNRVLRADGTGGVTAQGSAVTIDDSGNVAGVAALTASVTVTAPSIQFGSAMGDSILSLAGNALTFGNVLNGTQRIYMSGGVLCLNSQIGLIWSDNTTDALSGLNTRISRASSGVLQIGTSANNALGSLNLANLTASGTGAFGGSLVSGLSGIGGTPGFSARSGTMELSFVDFVSGQGYLSISNGTIRGFLGHTNNTDGLVFASVSAHDFVIRAQSNIERFRATNSGVSITGVLTVSGGLNLASRTKTAVLASSPATNAGRFQLSDSGLVGREVYPDGTNWRYASDDSIVT